MSESSEFLWRAVSGHADWSDGQLLSSMVGTAVELGLIGPASWWKRSWGAAVKPRRVEAAAVGDVLRHALRPSRTMAYAEVGGEGPGAWTISVSICPMQKDTGNVQGLNVIHLRTAAHVEVEALVEAFARVHMADDTEYAVLHPRAAYEALSDTLYERPVTTGTTFRGVFWGNYLGSAHLAHFDTRRLEGLPAHRQVRSDAGGMLLVTGSSPRELDSPRAVLETLTGRFRNALSPTCPWR